MDAPKLSMTRFYEVLYNGHKIGYVSADTEHDAIDLAYEQCLQSSYLQTGALAGETIDKRLITIYECDASKFGLRL